MMENAGFLRTQIAELTAERRELSAKPVMPARKSDAVMEAIAEVSGSDTQRRKRLGEYARTLRSAKVHDEEIISGLRNWPSTEDDG